MLFSLCSNHRSSSENRTCLLAEGYGSAFEVIPTTGKVERDSPVAMFVVCVYAVCLSVCLKKTQAHITFKQIRELQWTLQRRRHYRKGSTVNQTLQKGPYGEPDTTERALLWWTIHYIKGTTMAKQMLQKGHCSELYSGTDTTERALRWTRRNRKGTTVNQTLQVSWIKAPPFLHS